MKILLLYKNPSYVDEFIDALGLHDFHHISETEVADIVRKYPNGRLDTGYNEHITKTIATLVKAYRGKKSLLVSMHLDSQTAVNDIEHDISILLTDNRTATKLTESPTYKTTFRITYPFYAHHLDVVKQALTAIK